jgi:hypothetical protein
MAAATDRCVIVMGSEWMALGERPAGGRLEGATGGCVAAGSGSPADRDSVEFGTLQEMSEE